MMDAADRDYKLVAHTAPECTRLCKGEMMRVRRYAAAHEAGLSQHESPVILIAQANCFSQSTDCIAARLLFGGPDRCFLRGSRVRRAGRPGLVRESMRRLINLGRTVTSTMQGADRGEPCSEPLLHDFRVCAGQRVLGSQIPMRPGRRLIRRTNSRNLLSQAVPKACR